MNRIQIVAALACSVLLAACSTENVAYRYTVGGQTYSVLKDASHYDQTGVASWYGPTHQGRPTSSGQIFNMYAMTAASKVLPFYTYANVTNLDNGESAVVMINDRGPFRSGHIIDLSYAAAVAIGMVQRGAAKVRVKVLPGYRGVTSAAIHDTPGRFDDNGVYLQVGLLTSHESALRLQGLLKSEGLKDVSLQPAIYANRPATRVTVGPLKNAAAVHRAQSTLATDGIQAVPMPGQS